MGVGLGSGQREDHGNPTEFFRLRTQCEGSLERIGDLWGESRVLAGRVYCLIDQFGESGRSIHGLDKLEIKKVELQAALKGDEATLEWEVADINESWSDH